MAKLLRAAVGKEKNNYIYDVKMVQTLLNRHLSDVTIPKLIVDGKFGNKTKTSIEAFQKQEKLNADGILGPSGPTIKSLLLKTTANFVMLPLAGIGYYGKLPGNELYGSKKTIASLQSVGCLLAKDHKLEFGVVDISRSTGGYFPPHQTHRLGCNVDIRPLRKDNKRLPTKISGHNYSREKTEKLVGLLLKDPNVKSIVFSDKKIQGINFWAHHHDHLHVNFKE